MHENQGILLIITNGGKWHYLAVKILSAFLRGITSNHKKDLLFNFFFHSYTTKTHDYCYVEMPGEDNKILNYNHGEKYESTICYLC